MIRGHTPENENYHFRLDYRFNGLTYLLTSQAVRNIALIFLWLFSPLYVWEIVSGFGFSHQLSLALTISYFLLIFIAKLFCLPLAQSMASKVGFKGVIFLSSIPFLGFIPLLMLGDKHPIFLILSAILWGVHGALFWWGYNGFFIEAGSTKIFGRAMGVANILGTVMMVIAPILGAFVVEIFGFNSLFLFAGGIFVISLALLAPAPDHKPKVSTTTGEIIRLFKEHETAMFSYFGYAAEASLISTVWPLFLFLTLGAAISVGEVASGAALIAAALAFGIGFWIDKHKKRERRLLIALGAPLTALTWIIRAFANTVPAFIFIDATYRFVEPFVWMPLEVLAYKKAREGAVARAMMFREYAVTTGAIAITIIIIFWVLLGGSLAGTFAVAAVFALFPLRFVFKR